MRCTYLWATIVQVGQALCAVKRHLGRAPDVWEAPGPEDIRHGAARHVLCHNHERLVLGHSTKELDLHKVENIKQFDNLKRLREVKQKAWRTQGHPVWTDETKTSTESHCSLLLH